MDAARIAMLPVTTRGRNDVYTCGRTDPEGNPELVSFDSSVVTNTAYLTPDPVTGQADLMQDGNESAAFSLYDGIGNPVAALESWDGVFISASYDPYGVVTLGRGTLPDAIYRNPYNFKSGVEDLTTGLVKFGQRWYDPATGNWTQQDTLDAPLDPANANRYAYAGDDPINTTTLTQSAIYPRRLSAV